MAAAVFGGAAGLADVGVDGGSGEVSILAASCTSDEALRNSRMLRPSAAPTSGSLPGPRMSSAITRMMTSSRGPGVGIVLRVLLRYAALRGTATVASGWLTVA